jgi:hypothetical protein
MNLKKSLSVLIFAILFAISGQAKTNPGDSSKCATIYLYRVKGSVSKSTTFNVEFNDSTAWLSEDNKRSIIKYCKPGELKISANQNGKSFIRLQIEPGKVYYVRCSLSAGVMYRLQANFKQVDEATAKRQIEEIEAQNP